MRETRSSSRRMNVGLFPFQLQKVPLYGKSHMRYRQTYKHERGQLILMCQDTCMWYYLLLIMEARGGLVISDIQAIIDGVSLICH